MFLWQMLDFPQGPEGPMGEDRSVLVAIMPPNHSARRINKTCIGEWGEGYLAHFPINGAVIILLVYAFFFGGQGEVYAAEAAMPLVTTAAEPEGEGTSAAQGEAVKIEASPEPVTALVVAGRVHFVTGEVQATGKSSEARTLKKGDSINVGETVTSSQDASAQIRMGDGGLIALRPNTQLRVDSFKLGDKGDSTESSFFTLDKGGFRAVTGLIGRNNKHSYRITTPAAVIGINGTDHEVVYMPDNVPGVLAGTYSKVNSGGISLTTDLGTINVESNQMGYSAGMNQLPQLLPVNASLFSDAVDIKLGDAAPEKAAITPASPDEPMFVPAPIAWGGTISESFRKQKIEPGSSRLQHVQAANLRALTYLWQPWLAQVRGSIGVVNAKNVSGTSTDDGVSLSGGAKLSAVPYSRFPFTASYFVNDPRADTQVSPAASLTYRSVTNRSTAFVVEQRYRPQSKSSNSLVNYSRTSSSGQTSAVDDGGRENSRWYLSHNYRKRGTPTLYGGSLERKTSTVGASIPRVVTGLKGNYSTKYDVQSLAASAGYSQSQYGPENLNSTHVSLQHTHRPASLLSVATSAFVNQLKLSSPNLNSSNGRTLQLNSTASWQPDEELPFYVLGSIRLLNSGYDTLTSSTISKSQVGSVSVDYAATPRLKYRVHTTLANTRSGDVSARTTLTGVGASYNSEATKIGNAFRSWSANGGLDYRTSSTSASDVTVFGGVGQGLSLPYVLDKGTMDFNFNQSLAVREGGLGQTGTLTHSGGVYWRPLSSASLLNLASFSVADMRSFGDISSDMQTANLSVSSLYRTTAYSSAAADAILGWSANDMGQSSTNGVVNIKYNHTRAFNVKGLRYALTFNVSRRFDDTSGVSYGTEQRLEYAIGRAYLRLSASVAKQGRSNTTLIVAQLGRNFGDI